jgi:hypothetical protein
VSQSNISHHEERASKQIRKRNRISKDISKLFDKFCKKKRNNRSQVGSRRPTPMMSFGKDHNVTGNE